MAKRELYSNANIAFTCSEAFHYKGEIIVDEHCLVRVVSGELKVIQADTTFIFTAGSTHLFPRNQLATLIKHETDNRPYQAIVVKLPGASLQNFYTAAAVTTGISASGHLIDFGSSALLDSFFNSLLPYFTLNSKLPEELSALKINEAITILRTLDPTIDRVLADFSRPGKAELKEFMERNYMFNMPIEKFGYLTGRSLTTFKRDFKKAFNTTPQKWLTQKRLELAHFQLKQQHKKPIDVFYEVGFENLSHFSYAFKKHFGYAPTAVFR